MRMDWLMSDMKLSTLIELMRRKERSLADIGGGRAVSSAVMTRKWSEGDAGLQLIAG